MESRIFKSSGGGGTDTRNGSTPFVTFICSPPKTDSRFGITFPDRQILLICRCSCSAPEREGARGQKEEWNRSEREDDRTAELNAP